MLVEDVYESDTCSYNCTKDINIIGYHSLQKTGISLWWSLKTWLHYHTNSNLSQVSQHLWCADHIGALLWQKKRKKKKIHVKNGEWGINKGSWQNLIRSFNSQLYLSLSKFMQIEYSFSGLCGSTLLKTNFTPWENKQNACQGIWHQLHVFKHNMKFVYCLPSSPPTVLKPRNFSYQKIASSILSCTAESSLLLASSGSRADIGHK